eukprot:3789237-Rhodomonas_salina.1
MAYGAIWLRVCYDMSGTDRVYAPTLSSYARATRCPCYRRRRLRAYGALPGDPIALRACYAMSGTDTAMALSPYARATRVLREVRPVLSSVMLLRTPYALSGTDLAYAATSCARILNASVNLLQGIALRASYALSGTDLA